jgi:DNA polymerase-3 subunit gamma/tau
MATQALYRAWRPTTFGDVVGQDAIVTTLKNQIASGRVAHAYLFCGSRGTGKTTAAKIFARAVNCENPREGDPCGECPACLALAAENNLDIIEIDAASNNGVDEIRDLREKIKYPPQQARYRVYIIDEVHMLSTGAFNALLKTLEEPPTHALFILATTEPQRLPATVLSRCQRYDFRRIPARVIVGRMRTVAQGEKADVTDGALALIARTAEGGMRDALSLLDMCLSYGGGSADEALVRDVLGAVDRGFLFAFADALLRGDAAGAVRAVDALMRSGQ